MNGGGGGTLIGAFFADTVKLGGNGWSFSGDGLSSGFVGGLTE